MRLQTIIEVFDYWHRIRGSDAAPLRSAVEPAAVKDVLSSLFMLEDISGEIRFRLAGTRLCELFGRDPVGERFSGLWGASQRQHVDQLAHGVMHHLVPALCNATGYSVAGHRAGFEIILLPLRSRDNGCNLILGAMAPAAAATWLRIVPLEMLALDRSRLLHEHLLSQGGGSGGLLSDRHPGLAQSVLGWDPQAEGQQVLQ